MSEKDAAQRQAQKEAQNGQQAAAKPWWSWQKKEAYNAEAAQQKRTQQIRK